MKRIVVAVVGPFQVGKSTIVNCLLGREICATGRGLSTTHSVTRFLLGAAPFVKVRMLDGGIGELTIDDFQRGTMIDYELADVSLPLEMLTLIDLWDTPGALASGGRGQMDMRRAADVYEVADFFILVVPNRQLVQPLLEYLVEVLKGRLFVVLMNCIEGSVLPNSKHNATTAATIEAQLRLAALIPHTIPGCTPVWPVNAAWDVAARRPPLWEDPSDPWPTTEKTKDAEMNSQLLVDYVLSYYRSRRQSVPDVGSLRAVGGLDLVRNSFLVDTLVIGHIPDVVHLWRGFRKWSEDLRQAAGAFTAI